MGRGNPAFLPFFPSPRKLRRDEQSHPRAWRRQTSQIKRHTCSQSTLRRESPREALEPNPRPGRPGGCGLRGRPAPLSTTRGAARAGLGNQHERAGSEPGGCARARALGPGVWAAAHPCARRGEASPHGRGGARLEGRWSHLRAAEAAGGPLATSRLRRLCGAAGRSHPGRPGRRSGRVRAWDEEESHLRRRRRPLPAGLLAKDGGSLGKQ